MRHKIFPVILLLTALMLSCSSDTTPETDEQSASDMVQLQLLVTDQSGDPLSPAILHIYAASQGTAGKPAGRFYGNENGLIEARFQKNEPAILKVAAAWHRPVEIFIPSTALNELSVEVVPSSILKNDPVRPALIGDFNHFDPFNRVEMELNADGLWTAVIETEKPIIRYQITGFAQTHLIHGTDGKLEVDLDLQGIVSSLEPDEDGIARILFDPAQFPTAERRADLRFSPDVPLMIRGVAKIYNSMREQAALVSLHRENDEDVVELFEEYLDHVEHIKESFNHHKVEQAYRLSKARFTDYLQLGSQFIDNLLRDVESNSELWLFDSRFVHDLFTNSSKMEPVSKDIWDIYRQHQFEEIQSEALYSLLNYHYDRGEDEEWHEAHFELVRSYPQSKRINYSYREGFAPESVVQIGRYFPNLAYGPLKPEADSLRPAEIRSSLMILYFWSFEDPKFEEQFDKLESLKQRFSEKGIEIIPVALDEDRNRVKRFHQHRHHSWSTGLEKITNPQIQVLGVTETPHIIFLDRNNRVLYHGESILKDERLPDFVEHFYNN